MARINQVQYVSFYTAGSAAYKFDPKPEAKKKAKLPKYSRKKRIVLRVDPVAVIGVCVAMVMLVMMVSGLVQLGQINRQSQQMQDYVTRLETENVKLEAEYKAGYDLEEIRQIALAMGMVPADQVQKVPLQNLAPLIQEEEPSAWDNFYGFLVSLFA